MYKDIAKNLKEFVIVYPETIVPYPTDNDYSAGFIRRFFIRRANDEYGHIFEIDQSIYNEYLENPFWISANLKWRISGPADSVFNGDGKMTDMGVLASNKLSLGEASIKLKNIKLYLPNLLQFYKK
jgi:hypothetical protein